MSAVPYTNETPLPLGTSLQVRRMNVGGTAEEFAAPAGAPSGTGLAEIVAGAYVTAQRRGVLPAVRLAWVGPDAATVTGVAPALTLTADANGALGAIDGETPAVGDRVLTLYGASAKSLVWVIATLGDAGTPWTMTLAPDARSVGQLARGTLAQVSDGATYGDGRVWRLATTGTITPGTTVLTWERKAAVTADITAATAAYAADPQLANTDTSGTPGDATANTPMGTSALAAMASTVRITNSLVTTASNVRTQLTGAAFDATATALLVTKGAGFFDVTANAPATATTTFDWTVTNPA